MPHLLLRRFAREGVEPRAATVSHRIARSTIRVRLNHRPTEDVRRSLLPASVPISMTSTVYVECDKYIGGLGLMSRKLGHICIAPVGDVDHLC
jgi:hypothetical protein